jgi:hypothetical protein
MEIINPIICFEEVNLSFDSCLFEDAIPLGS